MKNVPESIYHNQECKMIITLRKALLHTKCRMHIHKILSSQYTLFSDLWEKQSSVNCNPVHNSNSCYTESIHTMYRRPEFNESQHNEFLVVIMNRKIGHEWKFSVALSPFCASFTVFCFEWPLQRSYKTKGDGRESRWEHTSVRITENEMVRSVKLNVQCQRCVGYLNGQHVNENFLWKGKAMVFFDVYYLLSIIKT